MCRIHAIRSPLMLWPTALVWMKWDISKPFNNHNNIECYQFGQVKCDSSLFMEQRQIIGISCSLPIPASNFTNRAGIVADIPGKN